MPYLSLNIGGVQGFIAQSRTTRDLWASSRMMSDFAGQIVEGLSTRGAEVIMPDATRTRGVPNRVWAYLPGDSPGLVQESIEQARRFWSEIPRPAACRVSEVFPDVRWVLVDGEDYAGGWRRAGELLEGRKRVSVFPKYEGTDPAVCSSCALRSACIDRSKAQFRLKRGERLCGQCVARRGYEARERFPSTSSIASGPFRVRVCERIEEGDEEVSRAVAALLDAIRSLGARIKGFPATGDQIPGVGRDVEGDVAARYASQEGAWSYMDDWSVESIVREYPEVAGYEAEVARLADQARRALGDLYVAMGSRPTSYLAVLSQDGDDMGLHLSRERDTFDEKGGTGSVDRAWHERVSKALGSIAQAHEGPVDEARGRLLYSGGDDLLALLPLEGSVACAAALRKRFREKMRGATASSALVYVHRSHSLQDAVARARRGLDEAKARGKNRLCLIVVRRGGERARSVLSWGAKGVDSVSELVGAMSGPSLSKRSVYDLDRLSQRLMVDGKIDSLGPKRIDHVVEQLTLRHSTSAEVARKVVELHRAAALDDRGADEWLGALHVGAFLASEGSS